MNPRGIEVKKYLTTEVADQKVAGGQVVEVCVRAKQNIDKVLRKLESKKESDPSWYPELKEETN